MQTVSLYSILLNVLLQEVHSMNTRWLIIGQGDELPEKDQPNSGRKSIELEEKEERKYLFTEESEKNKRRVRRARSEEIFSICYEASNNVTRQRCFTGFFKKYLLGHQLLVYRGRLEPGSSSRSVMKVTFQCSSGSEPTLKDCQYQMSACPVVPWLVTGLRIALAPRNKEWKESN